MSGAAYRDRGFGGVAEMDRKRIKEALEKHAERPSPSTSRGTAAAAAAKEKERLAAGKVPALGKAGKVSDGEEFETDSEDSDVSGSEGEDTSWISWFCSLRGNEFFCEIDDDYIQDDFNLCCLSNQMPYYDYALDLILDIESSNGDVFTEEQNELIESSAEMLYGLIHARYILTSKGLAAMLEKFKNYDFGRCPRVYCCGQPCLPAGLSDIPRSSTVKVKVDQGLEMLKIFKDHVSKTSILDDFAFYENRQKLMQEKGAKQQLLQGQGCDEKEKDAVNGKSMAQKQTLNKEGTTPVAGEVLDASKPTVLDCILIFAASRFLDFPGINSQKYMIIYLVG